MKIIVRRQPGLAARFMGTILIIGTTGVASCQALFNDKPAFYHAAPPAAEAPLRGGDPQRAIAPR